MHQDSESVTRFLQEFILNEDDNWSFSPDHKGTVVNYPVGFSGRIPYFINEFWTARQRQDSSIHEISYRACFKGQLPRYFLTY